MKIVILILSVTVILNHNLFSQCTCMGGASVGSLTPVGGTTNIGILKEDNIRVTSFISYSNGDEYLNGDSPAETGTVKSYSSSFLGLLIGYGIFEDFTIDAELGYFLNKTQDFGEYVLSGKGFSHATVYAKFNVLNFISEEIEWTIGLGGRIPLNFDDQNLPQNIQSSSGAYGAVLLSYLHQGFRAEGLHFILMNRAEINTENNSSYNYGSSFVNSVFITKSLYDKLIGILEVRSDVRLTDSQYGKEINDSGWNIVTLSPQINYSAGAFNLSVFYDFPVYKYYNGTQLTNSSNAGFTLTWQADLYNY